MDGWNKQEITCPTCIYLDLARRWAVQRRVPLRKAVKRYLRGTSRRTGVLFQELWEGTES